MERWVSTDMCVDTHWHLILSTKNRRTLKIDPKEKINKDGTVRRMSDVNILAVRLGERVVSTLQKQAQQKDSQQNRQITQSLPFV